MRTRPSSSGFTITELVVVVIILAILMFLAVPQYIKVIEGSRANHAASILQMIASASRQAALDGVVGPTFGNGIICNLGVDCTPNVPGFVPPTACTRPYDSSSLIACGYLKALDWNSQYYQYHACNGSGAGGSGCCGSCASAGLASVACAQRRPGGCGVSSSAYDPLAASTPYCDWAYCVDNKNFRVNALGGAPNLLQ